MKEARWKLMTADTLLTEQLQQALPMLPLSLLRMLIRRGIHTYDEARRFFAPSLADLHDPFLMKGMEAAVKRVRLAMEKEEKILIYGDYDVDGTTSVALVCSWMRDVHPHIDFYVPNRYTEGYGISFQGVDYAAEHGFSLIIALDCGIKEAVKVEYAREKGIDFIICDHHLPGPEIPAAVAVLDPKQSDCPYPYKELSGCGVGFKLMQALGMVMGRDPRELYRLMDLLAVSIASDIVPITGENRVLAWFGLQQLNEAPCGGLRELIQLSGIKRKLGISEVVFSLGPRINAAGRMEDARFAVKLLLGEAHAEETREHADKLQEMNKNRQTLDRDITAEALGKIESDPVLRDRYTTVLCDPGWHKGVIGIVASRLIESYYRPTIILTESEGKLAGSARSIRGFDLYEAIYECREHLLQFGGHTFAAGLSMKPEQLPAFAEKFETIARQRLKPEDMIPEIEIEGEVQLGELTDKYYRLIQRFAPFGPGNMRPVLLSRGVRDTGFARLLKDEHLKLNLQQGTNGVRFNAIGFRMAQHLELVRNGPVDIVYTLEENEWNGQISLQLQLKDIRAAEA